VTTALPHEVFRLDFDAILKEGKHQEELDPSNRGEYDLVKGIHTYYSGEVVPLIAQNDWVFQAASRLVLDHVGAYFQCVRLSGRDAFQVQTRLHSLNRQISDFISTHCPKALAGQTVTLTKASDFITLLELDELSKQTQAQATRLFEQVKDHEAMQLTVTLRNIRDTYEMGLPRVMFVVRRAMKVKEGIRAKSCDEDLLSPSDYIDWFTSHADNQHPFYPILGDRQLTQFYRVARNVASHHRGLEWESKVNQVILKDRRVSLLVHIREFQQRYRYLVYLCDYGLRAIFSAFCEREQGTLSDDLKDEYEKTFPEGFPAGETATPAYYTR